MKKCIICQNKHNTYFKHRPCCLSCFKRILQTERHLMHKRA